MGIQLESPAADTAVCQTATIVTFGSQVCISLFDKNLFKYFLSFKSINEDSAPPHHKEIKAINSIEQHLFWNQNSV